MRHLRCKMKFCEYRERKTYPQLILMADKVSKEMLIILLRQMRVRLADMLSMLVRNVFESSRY